MKILIFSWRGPGHPHAGGAEISTHEYAKGWIKAGHEVTLFTSDYKGCRHEEIIEGVKIKRFGSQILGVHLQAFKWYINGRQEQFDLVIDEFHGIPFFTPFFVRVKKLALIHEVTKEVWGLNPLPKPFSFIPAIFGSIFEPYLFLLYRNIPFMTGSDSTKKDLISWGIPESNITVIHYGLKKPPLKNLIAKNREKTLVFLGALAKDKGIEEVLEVFSYLNNFEKDWQFWVIGKGESQYQKYLTVKTKKLGISNKVKFWGFVNEEEKFKLLSRAHLLINTSIREGWGLVVMEAASVGTPTVGYNVPGLRDSIVNGKTGILTNKDPVHLATEVLKLIKDDVNYSAFRRNCLDWSKKFSWDKSVSLSLKLLDNLIAK